MQGRHPHQPVRDKQCDYGTFATLSAALLRLVFATTGCTSCSWKTCASREPNVSGLHSSWRRHPHLLRTATSVDVGVQGNG